MHRQKDSYYSPLTHYSPLTNRGMDADARLHFSRRTERRSAWSQLGSGIETAQSRHRVRRIWRRENGVRRLPSALSSLSAGGDVVCPRLGSCPNLSGPAVARRSLLPASASGGGDFN